MKNWPFILLLLAGCSQGLHIEDNSEDFNDLASQTLFEQSYPDKLSNVNYFDLVPQQIRESLPFGYTIGYNPDSVKSQKIKAISSKQYHRQDTLIGRLEFDELGNLLYEKASHVSEPHYFRYLFDEEGRVLKRLYFTDNKGLNRIDHFHYDKENRVSFVEVKIDGEIETGIDTILFAYDSNGNMIQAGDKTLEYDTNGNCIEWKVAGLGCGNSTSHWKGDYDEKGNLINSWSNSIHTFSIIFLQRDSLISEQGKLLTINTFDEDGRLSSTEDYEYY